MLPTKEIPGLPEVRGRKPGADIQESPDYVQSQPVKRRLVTSAVFSGCRLCAKCDLGCNRVSSFCKCVGNGAQEG